MKEYHPYTNVNTRFIPILGILKIGDRYLPIINLGIYLLIFDLKILKNPPKLVHTCIIPYNAKTNLEPNTSTRDSYESLKKVHNTNTCLVWRRLKKTPSRKTKSWYSNNTRVCFWVFTTLLLFQNLWGSWVGNHPQEDLAKFGYWKSI